MVISAVFPINAQVESWNPDWDGDNNADYLKTHETPGIQRFQLICYVIPLGLEPKTVCLEGRCSIQLSYGTRRTRVRDRRCKDAT